MAVRGRHPPEHVVVPPQHHLMDEDQTISFPLLEPDLPVQLLALIPLLGHRDLCKLFILQRQQQLVQEEQAVRTPIPGPLVDHHDSLSLLHHQDTLRHDHSRNHPHLSALWNHAGLDDH